jgi:hypothetical protein
MSGLRYWTLVENFMAFPWLVCWFCSAIWYTRIGPCLAAVTRAPCLVPRAFRIHVISCPQARSLSYGSIQSNTSTGNLFHIKLTASQGLQTSNDWTHLSEHTALYFPSVYSPKHHALKLTLTRAFLCVRRNWVNPITNWVFRISECITKLRKNVFAQSGGMFVKCSQWNLQYI